LAPAIALPGSPDAETEVLDPMPSSKASGEIERNRKPGKREKRRKKGCFSGRFDPNGPRSDAKNCDFRGFLITTQYTGCVYYVVDSVALELKSSPRKREFWGGGGGFALLKLGGKPAWTGCGIQTLCAAGSKLSAKAPR